MKRALILILSLCMLAAMLPSTLADDPDGELSFIQEDCGELQADDFLLSLEELPDDGPEIPDPTSGDPEDVDFLPAEQAEEAADPDGDPDLPVPGEGDGSGDLSALSNGLEAGEYGDEAEQYSVPEGDCIFLSPTLSNDELFAGYVERIFYGDAARRRQANAVSYAGDKLTGQDRILYDALKAEVLKIADGRRTSTRLKVPVAAVVGKGPYTRSELDYVFTWDMGRVIDALYLDCAYELYWLDFYQTGLSCSYESGLFIGTWDDWTQGYLYAPAADKGLIFEFPVLSEYQGGDRFTIDTARIQTAKRAAQNARSIVNRYAACSDYVKLYAYAKTICDLVDYNDDAVSGHWSMEQQDPWKLIWVFDGDSSTNVVCEGYSYAFQYLCELSRFDADIRCYLLGGDIDGDSNKRHAWNSVRMDDGRQYAVDVTWMDHPGDLGGVGDNLAEAISAERGSLFLCGGSGVSGSYHNIAYRTGGATTWRSYHDSTRSAYPASALTLASRKYVLTGFQRIGNDTYYFDGNGRYVTGTRSLDGVYYEFDASGRLRSVLTGWRTINGRQYFFEADGRLHTLHTAALDAAVPATCTASGLTAGSHCSVCEKILTAQEVVPAKGHAPVEMAAVEATCTQTGLTAGRKCSACGEILTAQQVILAKGHVPVADPAVKPTYTKTGLTAGSHCSVCGEVLVAQETVPKLDCSFHMKKSATKSIVLGDPLQIVVDGAVAAKSYATSNKKVATVSKTGYVTTKGEGTAKITVTLKNKKKLVLTLKVKHAKDKSVKYRALLIGEAEFPGTNSTDMPSRKSVSMMKNVMKSVKGPMGNKWTVTTAINRTTEGIHSEIRRAFKGAKEDDISPFMICTHGNERTRITESYDYAGSLQTYDGTLQLPVLAQWLGEVPGKVIVLIDSCGSGAAIYRSNGGGDFEPADFNQAVINAFAAADPGVVVSNGTQDGAFVRQNKFYVMTASAYLETSWHMIGNYHYFIKWLTDGVKTKGSMPADSNKNKYLTLKEWYKYVSKKAKKTTIVSRADGRKYKQHVQVYPANCNTELICR